MPQFVTPGVMGILNVTPDSFADGGRYFDPDAAIAKGMEMYRQGATLVDVGGESTRPGAAEVNLAEERRRVLPVVTELARHGAVSIDTRHRDVAEAALEAGATMLNDVSATLWPVAAEAAVAWVAMHSPAPGGSLADMHRVPDATRSLDGVRDVLAFCRQRAETALAAGVPTVFIDPGLGFGKDVAANLALVAGLERFVASGHPVIVGASRKRFVGAISVPTVPPGQTGPPGRVPEDAQDRLAGSLAVATWAYTTGVALVRAHDVNATVAALRLVHEPVPWQVLEGSSEVAA